MAQIIQEIRVEVAKKNTFQALVAKQYDYESRYLKVTLVHDGEKIEIKPTSTALINANRIDGQSKSFLGEANDDGTANVPLNSWMLELDGELHCDISIIDAENRKLTSTSFLILVEKAAGGDISENPEVDVLVSLIDECTQAAENANAAAKKVIDLDQTHRLLNAYVHSTPSLTTGTVVQLQATAQSIGVGNDQCFIVVSEDDWNVYFASINAMLEHVSGGTQLMPIFNAGIPYTPVSVLPEASEETKNKIYKKGGCYYVTRGSGSTGLESGQTYGRYDKLRTGLTEAELHNILDALYGYDTNFALFSANCDGEIWTFYWSSNNEYNAEGNTFVASMGWPSPYQSSYTISSLVNGDITFGDLNSQAGCNPNGSTFIITEVTELGQQIFGGTKPKWVNFLTNEEV